MPEIPKSKIDPVTELVNQNSSRYSLKRPMNGLIDFENLKVYNYPWNCEIQKSEGDVYIEIVSGIRLDQLANNYYGDPKLWWAIAQINNVKNPLTDLKIGMLIRIPLLTSLIKSGVTR